MTEVEVEAEAEAEAAATQKFTITHGDITLLRLNEGAIVNPSNTGLILGFGISEQIARRAGPFFQQQLHMARSGLRGNRLEMGRTLATEAGSLFCKNILHVSIIGKKKVDRKLITNAILNIYDLAEELELEELAFPALGVGIGKFPLEEFLELFWQITLEELPRSESLKHVYLCLYDDAEFDVAEVMVEKHADELPEGLELEVSRGDMWAGLG